MASIEAMFGDPAGMRSLASRLDSVAAEMLAAASSATLAMAGLIFSGPAANRAREGVRGAAKAEIAGAEELRRLASRLRSEAFTAEVNIQAYHAQQRREAELREQQRREAAKRSQG